MDAPLTTHFIYIHKNHYTANQNEPHVVLVYPSLTETTIDKGTLPLEMVTSLYTSQKIEDNLWLFISFSLTAH